MILVDRGAVMAKEYTVVDADVDFIKDLLLLVAYELSSAVHTVLVLCGLVIQKPREYFFLQR